jgi:hypothetical protein
MIPLDDLAVNASNDWDDRESAALSGPNRFAERLTLNASAE